MGCMEVWSWGSLGVGGLWGGRNALRGRKVVIRRKRLILWHGDAAYSAEGI
jgi:hypothetical protein